jgi:hypothetical protein
LLAALPHLHMVLLDFSSAMHELARRRLGPMTSRVDCLEKSFKDADWSEDAKSFDAVVTNQAVHELRHKRYAVELHRQVRTLLRPGGSYLVCDHFYGPDGMTNHQLYMTIEEQKSALETAGFSVGQVLLKGGMVLHHAV